MRRPRDGQRAQAAPWALRVVACCVLALLALAPAAPAQAQEDQPDQQAGEEPQATAPPEEPEDLSNIDEILEGEEEVLSGEGGYNYDPGNRRDPFKSLLVARDRPEFRGPRPEGIPGLLIDEIRLTGIIRTARGFVAQVKASNQGKSYLLKPGDQVYDGDVISINRTEVVFKQLIQDPTALKPFREVVKTLSP